MQRTTILIILLLGYPIYMYAVLVSGFAFEGAFVTFRYSLNLAQGLGFTFNSDQHVLGTTTPLIALILTPLAWLSGKDMFPITAQIFLAFTMALAAYVNDLILKRLGSSNAARLLVILLIFFHPEFLRSAASGMETPIVCLMMSFGLLSLLSGRTRIAATLACCQLLVRPDSLPWSMLLTMGILKSVGIRQGLRSFWIGSAVLFTYTIFTFFYFGSPIPQSVLAKSGWFHNDLAKQGIAFGEYLLWIWKGMTGTISIVDPVSILGMSWPILFILGLIRLNRSATAQAKTVLNISCFFPVIFYLFYLIGKGATYCSWYLIPLMWITFIPVGLGITSLLNWSIATARKGAPLRIVCAAMLLVGIFTELAVTDRGILTIYAQSIRSVSGLERRVGRFIRVKEAEASLLTRHFAIIGYESDSKILDPVGLITPEALELLKKGLTIPQVFIELIRTRTPDLVVVVASELYKDATSPGFFVDQANYNEFLKNYIQIQNFESDEESDPENRLRYLIFKARKLPVAGMDNPAFHSTGNLIGSFKLTL